MQLLNCNNNINVIMSNIDAAHKDIKMSEKAKQDLLLLCLYEQIYLSLKMN